MLLRPDRHVGSGSDGQLTGRRAEASSSINLAAPRQSGRGSRGPRPDRLPLAQTQLHTASHASSRCPTSTTPSLTPGLAQSPSGSSEIKLVQLDEPSTTSSASSRAAHTQATSSTWPASPLVSLPQIHGNDGLPAGMQVAEPTAARGRCCRWPLRLEQTSHALGGGPARSERQHGSRCASWLDSGGASSSSSGAGLVDLVGRGATGLVLDFHRPMARRAF